MLYLRYWAHEFFSNRNINTEQISIVEQNVPTLTSRVLTAISGSQHRDPLLQLATRLAHLALIGVVLTVGATNRCEDGGTVFETLAPSRLRDWFDDARRSE